RRSSGAPGGRPPPVDSHRPPRRRGSPPSPAHLASSWVEREPRPPVAVGPLVPGADAPARPEQRTASTGRRFGYDTFAQRLAARATPHHPAVVTAKLATLATW